MIQGEAGGAAERIVIFTIRSIFGYFSSRYLFDSPYKRLGLPSGGSETGRSPYLEYRLSATSIPRTTRPIGANLSVSRLGLSDRLMNTFVVRSLGLFCANDSVPRMLRSRAESAGMVRRPQRLAIAGSPAMPN